MTTYTAYNVVLSVVLLPIAARMIRSLEHFSACLRTSLTIMVIAVPWGAFARTAQVWEYTDPGPTLYGVAINDLWFISTCTFFASALLTWDRTIDA